MRRSMTLLGAAGGGSHPTSGGDRAARNARRVLILAMVVGLVVAVMAAPSEAKGKDTAPAQICKEIDNTFPPIDDRPFPFTIPSDGGCASSVAQGFDGTLENQGALSKAAFNAQCKFLEEVIPLEYPYAFYGNPDYLAKNRADCQRLLYGFHNGLLEPGPG